MNVADIGNLKIEIQRREEKRKLDFYNHNERGELSKEYLSSPSTEISELKNLLGEAQKKWSDEDFYLWKITTFNLQTLKKICEKIKAGEEIQDRLEKYITIILENSVDYKELMDIMKTKDFTSFTFQDPKEKIIESIDKNLKPFFSKYGYK